MHTSSRRVHLFRKKTGSYETINGIPYEYDLETCLALAHKSAYEAQLDDDMKELWKPLLAERRIMLSIVEEKEERQDSEGRAVIHVRPVGFRFICFVTDAFVTRARMRIKDNQSEPSLQLKPPLTRFLFECHRSKEKSPILTRKEIAHANAYQTLNMFTFTPFDPIVFESKDRLRSFVSVIVNGLLDSYRGYMLNSCLFESYTEAAKSDARAWGAEIISEFDNYYQKNSHITSEKRLYVGYLRYDSLKVASLPEIATKHIAPVLNLTSLHKETLELILEGANDHILEEHYNNQPAAIRNRFGQMFKRVRNKPPLELMERVDRDSLLRYVEKHPEEIRPYKL